MANDRGQCVCPTGAVEVLGGCASAAVLIPAILFPTVAALLLCNAAVLARVRRGQEESEDRRLLRLAVAALRARLGITARDGFVVGAERPPLRLRADRVQAVPVEAAGRLALRLDYDVGHFDLFCLAVTRVAAQTNFWTSSWAATKRLQEVRSPQHTALRCWLLEVGENLIEPNLDEGEGGVRGALTSVAEGQKRSLKALAGLQGPSEAMARLRESDQGLRFDYFVRFVGRAQAWREDEGELFVQLQLVAAKCLRRVAGLCDARLRALAAAPGGEELLRLREAPALW